MRVFTQRERKIFESAFDCVCRVVAATHSTPNLYEIKVFNDRETEPLPQEIQNLFKNSNIIDMQNLFCLANKERAIDHLISIFQAHKIQPRKYIFYGLLGVKKIQTTESDYVDDVRYSA